MKIIDIPILQDPIFCKWRLFPGNNIKTDQKHWKNHCRLAAMIFFNALKFITITSNRNIDLSQFWRSKKHNLSLIYVDFRLKFIRKHVWPHVDSCRVSVVNSTYYQVITCSSWVSISTRKSVYTYLYCFVNVFVSNMIRFRSFKIWDYIFSDGRLNLK